MDKNFKSIILNLLLIIRINYGNIFYSSLPLHIIFQAVSCQLLTDLVLRSSAEMSNDKDFATKLRAFTGLQDNKVFGNNIRVHFMHLREC